MDKLINGSIPCDDSHYIFQIIYIGNGQSQSGRKTQEVTVSDGVTCVNCFLAPQLFHLLDDGICTKYDVVKVSNFVCNEVEDGYKIVLLQMLKHSTMHEVIGEPSFMKMKQKRPLKETATGTQNVKRQQLLMKNDDTENEASVASMKQSGSYVGCENCNQLPREWSEYGPSILQHIENEYLGRYVDHKGNIVDEQDGVDIIGNKQLCFIAYSAYTSLKHGYLGKQNRVKIPHCVKCCIHVNFPDDNNAYVGFKHADN